MSLININKGSRTVTAIVSGTNTDTYIVTFGSDTKTNLSNGDKVEFKDLNPLTNYSMVLSKIRIPRIIKLTKGGEDALNIAEVQAFDLNNVNVALSGNATQSSTSFNAVASRGIDGNTDGRHGMGGTTHTVKHNGTKWWQVVLQNSTKLDRIVIYNRTDCCSNRMSGVSLQVFDEDGVLLKSWTLSSSRIQTLNF